MIGIDTNILVRFFVKDDPTQTPAAVRMIHGLSPEEPGWISLLVFVGAGSDTRRVYKLDRAAIAGVL